jgi:hypothetical protein
VGGGGVDLQLGLDREDDLNLLKRHRLNWEQLRLREWELEELKALHQRRMRYFSSSVSSVGATNLV